MVRPNRDKLSGLVEVDETFVGSVHSGKRGRGAEGKSLIFIAAEEATRGIGRIRGRMRIRVKSSHKVGGWLARARLVISPTVPRLT